MFIIFRLKCRMNRHCPAHRKLVHVDATMCAEMSNTADGTKCLREPMSASASDSKTSRGLFPHPSRKRIKSSNESFHLSGSSGFNNNCADVDPSDSDGCRQEQLSDSDNCNKSEQPKCSVEFVSARQYMNPTLSLLEDHPPENNNSVASVQPTMHDSVRVSKAIRKPNKKQITTTQKNSLDRYFKPVCVSKTSTDQAVAVAQPHTVCATDHAVVCSFLPENSPQKSVLSHTVPRFPGSNDIQYCSRLSQNSTTPENSPRKSVLSSPISKLPGSDTIYYCSPSSRNSTCSSSAGNTSQSHESCASAAGDVLDDDDDDFDFESSFNVTWKINPRTKCKSARRLDQPSHKQATVTSATEMSKNSNKSDAFSSDMSAENFGLFGFSNNTLLALDSDTDFEEDTTDYFSMLPPEVVSNILCRLPFTDLCLNVNRVCLSWKNIVDSDDVSYFYCGTLAYYYSLYIVAHLSVSRMSPPT